MSRGLLEKSRVGIAGSNQKAADLWVEMKSYRGVISDPTRFKEEAFWLLLEFD